MDTVKKLQDQKLVIAIDGHSSCGKSTIAKGLAEALMYKFIDTGAMYRAVAWHAISNDIALVNLSEYLDQIQLHFANEEGINKIYLNGQDVSKQIRKPEVSAIVSEVATLSPVRKKLVSLQQSYGVDGAIVMDGRDIASTVFPEADIKLFVTADIDVRAQRRYVELMARDNMITLDEVKANLAHRDHIDSTRVDSPLTQVPDAILVDTTRLSRKDQLFHVLEIIAKKVAV